MSQSDCLFLYQALSSVRWQALPYANQMTRFVYTRDISASYDFFLNLIDLKRLKTEHIPRIQGWFASRDVFSSGGQVAREAREDKADLVHEVTHFIDATTTLWGLEYNMRKALVLQQLIARQPLDTAMSVFMLNTAEIDAHESRHKAAKESPKLTACTMRHRLTQDSRWGPLIVISYWHEAELVMEVPLTMLSVLEANAYANETLSRLNDVAVIRDEAERTRLEKDIERNYSASMEAHDSSEYTVLLHLANIHFPFLDLNKRLRMVIGFARLALDMDTYALSTLADWLQPTFANEVDGASVAMDMRRGSSRPVVIFKVILLLPQYLETLSAKEHELACEALSSGNSLAMREVLEDMGFLEQVLSGVNEMEMYMDWLQPHKTGLDHLIIPASVRSNRALAEQKPCADCFFDLTIPDPRMDEGRKSVRLPKRMEVETANISSERLLPLKRLHAHYQAADVSKFYMKF